MSGSDAQDDPAAQPRQFTTTRWSVILTAGGEDMEQAERALAELCRAYWYPLYAYARRQGADEHDAQDLTQSFFESIIRRNDLTKVHPKKGRFRSWLLNCMKHFMLNEWKKARRLKRGGQYNIVSLDADEAEERYRREPADTLSADRIFERRWALTVIENALDRLESEYESAGKGDLFQLLKNTITGDDEKVRYAEIAEQVGLSEGGVKTAVHRLRKRQRELIRAAVMETVSTASEADEELRHLMGVLS